MTVPSPCISICAMDETTGFCKGCKRTINEVAMWLYMTDDEKALVVAELEKRRLPGEK